MIGHEHRNEMIAVVVPGAMPAGTNGGSGNLGRNSFSMNRSEQGAIRYRRVRGESENLFEMRWIPVALMGVHGLIHLMGFAKGFGYADLPQLTQPISRAWGLA